MACQRAKSPPPHLRQRSCCSAAEFRTGEEGLCVQIMHIGPFDTEPASVVLMGALWKENGYETI